jgi:predicted RNase H-like nuclease (RuvC/YqgF family)
MKKCPVCNNEVDIKKDDFCPYCNWELALIIPNGTSSALKQYYATKLEKAKASYEEKFKVTAEFKRQLEYKTKEIDKLKSEIVDLKQNINSKDATISNLNDENNRLKIFEKQTAELQNQITKEKNEYSNLLNKTNNLEQENSNLKQELDKCQKNNVTRQVYDDLEKKRIYLENLLKKLGVNYNY